MGILGNSIAEVKLPGKIDRKEINMSYVQYIMHNNIKVIQRIQQGENSSIKILEPDFAPVNFLSAKKLDEQWTQFVSERVPILTDKNLQVVKDYFHEKFDKQLSCMSEDLQKVAMHNLIANEFYGTSISDNFWIATNNEPECINYDDIDPKKHELKEICRHQNLSIEMSMQNELATEKSLSMNYKNGAAYKIWKHDDKDNVTLYKRGNLQDAKKEVAVSKFLDFTNIDHVQYNLISDTCCKCQNIANDDVSLISGNDVFSYCVRNDINYDAFTVALDQDMYYTTKVIDFLIDNSDRTIYNQGFLRDNETGYIIGIQPLFDHGDAFDKELMEQDKLSKEYQKRLEIAKNAIKHIDIKLDIRAFNSIENPEWRKSVIEKSKELGIIIEKEKTFLHPASLQISPIYQLDLSQDNDREFPAQSYSIAEKSFVYDDLDNELFATEQETELLNDTIEKNKEINRDDFER